MLCVALWLSLSDKINYIRYIDIPLFFAMSLGLRPQYWSRQTGHFQLQRTDFVGEFCALFAFAGRRGVTSERHFDKTCFAFMAFTRGNFCLAINLITKCHECSSVFNLSHYLEVFCRSCLNLFLAPSKL